MRTLPPKKRLHAKNWKQFRAKNHHGKQKLHTSLDSCLRSGFLPVWQQAVRRKRASSAFSGPARTAVLLFETETGCKKKRKTVPELQIKSRPSIEANKFIYAEGQHLFKWSFPSRLWSNTEVSKTNVVRKVSRFYLFHINLFLFWHLLKVSSRSTATSHLLGSQ